jgi:hypothetical protein
MASAWTVVAGARPYRPRGDAPEARSCVRTKAEASRAAPARWLDDATRSSSLAGGTHLANPAAPPRVDRDPEPDQARQPHLLHLEGGQAVSRRARRSRVPMRRGRGARGLPHATTTRHPARERISGGYPRDRSYSATGIGWLGRRAPGLDWSSSCLLESSLSGNASQHCAAYGRHAFHQGRNVARGRVLVVGLPDVIHPHLPMSDPEPISSSVEVQPSRPGGLQSLRWDPSGDAFDALKKRLEAASDGATARRESASWRPMIFAGRLLSVRRNKSPISGG